MGCGCEFPLGGRGCSFWHEAEAGRGEQEAVRGTAGGPCRPGLRSSSLSLSPKLTCRSPGNATQARAPGPGDREQSDCGPSCRGCMLGGARGGPPEPRLLPFPLLPKYSFLPSTNCAPILWMGGLRPRELTVYLECLAHVAVSRSQHGRCPPCCALPAPARAHPTVLSQAWC